MGLPQDCYINLPSKFKKGKRNLITDVKGVRVGQVTLEDSSKTINTGVTAIIPNEGNLFKNKIVGATSVINGFGKSVGLVQIDELGTIESPIIMTNTFSVGTALNATIKYMLKDNEDIGIDTGTINCVVTECNDGRINNIREMAVTEDDVLEALNTSTDEFDEGDVGSGTGMVCMEMKGGIGSASRIVTCDGNDYTIGAIVMTNFGMAGNLRINGKKVEDVREDIKQEKEQGSCILIIGTDLPMSSRQLRRVAKRATVSLSRTGSFLGNGSGDIAVAFSNGNTIPHYSDKQLFDVTIFNDDKIDDIFEATAEVVEESIISSLYHAKTRKGLNDKVFESLNDIIAKSE